MDTGHTDQGAPHSALFSIGDLVQHRLFGYRGVIIDADPVFQLTDEWYETMAKSRPPKDSPWYRVLVHDATHETYVAERNLEPDALGEPVNHPSLGQWFDRLEAGRYRPLSRAN